MTDEPTRTVSVRLFGPQAKLAGRDAVELQAPAGVTAADLKTLLARAEPALAGSLPASRIAVDHEYAAPTDPVPAGAEVALIGLVSGG